MIQRTMTRAAVYRYTLVVAIAAALTGCNDMSVSSGPEAFDPAVAIASAPRSEDDMARDAGRKPAEVVAFLGIQPGMQVLDLIAAGGWYTEVLAAVVGESGKVYAQNPKVVLEFRDGANDRALTQRLADARLPNVERLDTEIADLGIAPDSIDAAFSALNLHDVYNTSPDAAKQVLQAVRTVLKPGGILGIVDHAGSDDGNNASLHRMTRAQAIDVISASGFEFVAESDVLANPDDDHSEMVFSPSVRGQTDRFLLKFRKPV